MTVALTDLAPLFQRGTPRGITSICSAHPVVLRAALRHARDTALPLLIEATCNQVNHQGGYTGLTPADFARLVADIARDEGCAPSLYTLGGDHLGPNPWRHLPADAAMGQAQAMIAAYVAAGFSKIHLDASMGCLNEAEALDDATTAQRAAQLARVAEETAVQAGLPPPHYIIGTEVPPPGGADHALTTIAPTAPDAARQTIAAFRAAFAEQGLQAAFARVIGLVVQPGVEFGNENVIPYDPAAAVALTEVLKSAPDLVFEAHSTDYQGTQPLSHLVRDGFPILKVGPELTFALREALYALDMIATDLLPDYPPRQLFHAMEAVMLAQPDHWQRHCSGDTARAMRHYSLSDRIRYYWAAPQAQAAVAKLLQALQGKTIPLPLIWQHLPSAPQFANTPLNPNEVLLWRVGQTIRVYHSACLQSEN